MMERDTERERRDVQQTWEEAGREVAPSLDAASAVVVIGADPAVAAAVAIGAGRAQGARRRVAIGDLVGDVPPLTALVTGDDPHGLVDSFLYGVSLNRIARPAVGIRNLYVLPSGTEPVVAEEIFRNERWHRLAIGFSEVGALLLLVARADAPGVDALVAQLDGALVADGATAVPPGVRVLAVADAPASLAPTASEPADANTAEMAIPLAAAATASGGDEPTADEPVAAEPALVESAATEREPTREVPATTEEHAADAASPAPATRDEEIELPVATAADLAAGAATESTEPTGKPIAGDELHDRLEERAAADREAEAAALGAAVAATATGAPADADAERLAAADGGYDGDEGDEPRDARWIRRVVNAPPTQIHISAQGAGADAGNAGDRAAAASRTDEGWRPSRQRWLLPLAAAIVVAVGLLALLTRGNNAGTRTEAGRRAGGTATRVADQPAATPPNDSAALVAAGTTAAPASSAAAVGGEVAPAAGAAAGGTAGATGASGAAAGATTKPAGEGALPTLAVANPADSARAAMYAVQIVAANTLEGAKTKQRDVAWGLPAAVVSPMALAPDNTRWFRLTVGAFPTRNDAAAYTMDLRRRRKLDLDAGNVVLVPYALLLADHVPRASAAARVAAFNARGLAAYALLQPDGTARVYAGAFETPQQAALMASALTVADITPVVVYRTGRAL